MKISNLLLAFVLLFTAQTACAQVGEYRNQLSVGATCGVAMTNVAFTPRVTQALLPGATGGLVVRYTSEKYFKMICSIAAEINYTQMGWRENIIDLHQQPVLGANGQAEKYERRLSYIQMPILAHMAWGKEEKGFQFFFQAGPQFGYMLGESTKTNFDIDNANLGDRANPTNKQYSMPVENKLDYGICAGLGVEMVHPSLGHFLLGGRYYYGLGNLYGSAKKDYFAKSNQSAIEIRLSYLFDLRK